MEADYKTELRTNFGIRFNRLFTITNQPIARFAEDLRRSGALEPYLELLANSFNPETTNNLMCRLDPERRLPGRAPRLRLQPDALPSACRKGIAAPVGREAGGTRRGADRDRFPLLRLHRRVPGAVAPARYWSPEAG